MHLKLTIQYDGTGFAGSQLQPRSRGRTVQGELEEALETLAGVPVRVALAGRTDSGVHALGQVGSLDFPERAGLASAAKVRQALNAKLPVDLAVTDAEVVPPEFHARFSARKRAYRYLILNSETRRPLVREYALHVRRELDVEAMARAAELLAGTHDFAAFAGSGLGVPGGVPASTVREIVSARVHKLPAGTSLWAWNVQAGTEVEGDVLVALDLVANAYLPQMVRNIVGTLLEVGYGRRTPASITELIESRDRRLSGPTAKPHGLCLLWVEY